MEVRLIGEGGVEWTFSLPLKEVFADQVKSRKMLPADDESAAALAELLLPREAEAPLEEQTAQEDGKPIDKLTGPECDAKAAELGIDPWDAKAKVADKRSTVASWIESHKAAGEPAADDDLDDLSDDDLHAKADELGIAVDVENYDRDELLAALREKLAE